jgi:hypothetical protein
MVILYGYGAVPRIYQKNYDAFMETTLMTARSVVFRFVLAGLGTLALSGAGLAETRLISDPNGVVSSMAAVGSNCCSTEDPAAASAGAPATPSTPAVADEVAVGASAPGGGDPAQLGSAADPPAGPSAEINASETAAPPQSTLRRLLTGLVQLGGATSR